MFDQFLLLKDLSPSILDSVLSQNDLYSKLTQSDIVSLPEINLDNFVNICNFVDYYQLIDDSIFIANIQYHILCNDKEVIDNMHLIPLYMQQKVYQNPCIKEMDCTYIENGYYNNIEHIACYKYLKKKYDIDYTIDIASKYGNLEVIKYLFKIGEKCTTDAIYNASQYGHLKVVKYLFEDQNQDCTGTYAIDAASQKGHLEVQHKDCTEFALDQASQYGHFELVKYLFEIQHKDCSPHAIDLACWDGHLEIIKYLFEIQHKDCSIYAIDNASECGYLEVIKYLFEIQGKRNCTTNAIDSASQNGHLEVIQYLFEVMHQDCTTDAINWVICKEHYNVIEYLLITQNKKYTQETLDYVKNCHNSDKMEIYLKTHYPNSFLSS